MINKIKILHLEDSTIDSELIHSYIESGGIGHDYFLADNEKDFMHILETENIDIILSDYSLPDYNGNDALKVARGKYSYIPFIFVSGAMGEDAAINAMLNGATDYVLKNKLERLVPAIKRALREYELESKRRQDEIDLKEKNEQIEAQNEKYVQINQELAFQNEEKEKRAAELVITNNELAKAKEEAEQSNKIKSIFLTNLSHELRTPLNGVLGFSQLITGTDDKQQIIEFAKIINKSGNQLLTIIEDLFIVSSILSENIIKKIRDIQLISLLDKARFIINDEILKSDKEGLTFSVFEGISEESAAINADIDMYGEIIRKLIRNAIKFTDNGKIEVGYRIENKENIIFYVSDNGIGIPVEKQGVIFDFFRQVEESSKKKFGGIGSGLAICKSFAEKMNGFIRVESQPGKGSTFFLTLPLATQPSGIQESPATNYMDGFKMDLSNKTILIVDDFESNRLFLEYILKDMGSKVLSAENGQAALDLVKKTKSLDLVLMDLNMPVMDGYESTRLIKKIRPDVPVIVQTAYALAEHMERAKNAGCDAFVKKPINIKDLIAAMKECLMKAGKK